jgi:hypothetical protein
MKRLLLGFSSRVHRTLSPLIHSLMGLFQLHPPLAPYYCLDLQDEHPKFAASRSSSRYSKVEGDSLIRFIASASCCNLVFLETDVLVPNKFLIPLAVDGGPPSQANSTPVQEVKSPLCSGSPHQEQTVPSSGTRSDTHSFPLWPVPNHEDSPSVVFWRC